MPLERCQAVADTREITEIKSDLHHISCTTSKKRTKFWTIDFYARQHVMLSASLLRQRRPSVCPSVTLLYCVKTTQLRIMKSSLCHRFHTRWANSGKITLSKGVPLFDALVRGESPHLCSGTEITSLETRDFRLSQSMFFLVCMTIITYRFAASKQLWTTTKKQTIWIFTHRTEVFQVSN